MKKTNDAIDTGNNSNDSFKFEAHSHTSPKAETLMWIRKQSASLDGKIRYTYQEDLGLLDNKLIFESVIHDGRDMYELVTGVTGKPTVIDRVLIAARLALVEDIIQFPVFCHEYRNAYVGAAIDEKLDRDEIISQSNGCNLTRKMVTIVPDKVYAKYWCVCCFYLRMQRHDRLCCLGFSSTL